jgi:hypothetical protein
MAHSPEQQAQAAWARIESLGGHGVWEPDMVVVSLAGTGITNEDLKLFNGFPHVQILDLSDTEVGDDGLGHIAQIPALEELIIVNTRIGDRAIDRFRSRHPAVKVTTQSEPRGVINPFTGSPF